MRRRPALAPRVPLGVLFLVGVLVGLQSGFGAFWFVPYGAAGTALAIRRPRLSIGWILLGLAWCFDLVTQSVVATPQQFADGTVDGVTTAFAIASASLGSVGFFLIALLAMVFPSGTLPDGRWGVAARVALGFALASIVAGMVVPQLPVNLWGNATSVLIRNPLAVMPELAIWSILTPDTLILPEVLVMAAAAVSLVIRYRGSQGVERQQLRWLAAALAFVVVAVVGGFLLGLIDPALADSGLIWLGAIVAFPCVPIAVGIAVLRFRLYEIDRIISRTIGWAVVTGVLLAIFAGIVVALQALLAGVTQGQTLAVAASTLASFALFQPLRRRVQGAVDRKFDRARYDAQRTVDAFATKARNSVDLLALRLELVRTTDQAVRPITGGVWLRGATHLDR